MVMMLTQQLSHISIEEYCTGHAFPNVPVQPGFPTTARRTAQSLADERGVLGPFMLTPADTRITQIQWLAGPFISFHFISLNRGSMAAGRSCALCRDQRLSAGNETGPTRNGNQLQILQQDTIPFFSPRCLKMSHFVSFPDLRPFFFARKEGAGPPTNAQNSRLSHSGLYLQWGYTYITH
jgi:hypothetical protein